MNSNYILEVIDVTSMTDQLIAVVIFGLATFILPAALNRFADSRSHPR